MILTSLLLILLHFYTTRLGFFTLHPTVTHTVLFPHTHTITLFFPIFRQNPRTDQSPKSFNRWIYYVHLFNGFTVPLLSAR